MANMNNSNSDINNTEENSLPFLLELEEETDRTLRICKYLHNLRDRLKENVQQHTELLKSSVSILKEVGDVAATLALMKTGSQTQSNKIKFLIMEFESVSCENANSPSLPNHKVELRGLVADFERLNENQLLRESLMSFKRAKDSFEKIGHFLESSDSSEPPHTPEAPSQLIRGSGTNRSLRERIEAFNKVLEAGENTPQHFVNCFSSHCSLEEAFTSVPETKPAYVVSRTNSGYEGDVDSEIEQAASKGSAEK